MAITSTSAAATGATLDDLLLVLVATFEEQVATALGRQLGLSRHYASAIDATAHPIRRKQLAQRIGILVSNMNKTIDPLVDAGWIRTCEDADGMTFQRSPVVDRVMKGKSARAWLAARERR